MNKPRNMFDKIWDRHVVAQRDDGEALIYVDRNFVHEGPFYAFDKLRLDKRPMRRPLKQIAISDHYLPTLNRAGGLAGIKDPEIRNMVEQLERNARDFKVPFIGMSDPARQGIMHVVGPDLGLVQPGMVITAADSHTTTNGAFGAFSFGIGASEIKHVMATQALWYRKPRTFRVTVDGKLPPGVTAKDVILVIIAKVGISGAVGHVFEFAGPVMRAMSMEQRMTVCNMSIEAGARAGLVAPDETTYSFLKGREFAPAGADWERALALWKTLPTDDGATFDKEVTLNGSEIAPMVTWGTVPDDALPITGNVPDPAHAELLDGLVVELALLLDRGDVELEAVGARVLGVLFHELVDAVDEVLRGGVAGDVLGDSVELAVGGGVLGGCGKREGQDEEWEGAEHGEVLSAEC